MQESEIGTPIQSEFPVYPAILNVDIYLNLERPR